MTTAALWRVLLHVRPSCACWTSIRCTAYVKKLVSLAKLKLHKKTNCFATFSDFIVIVSPTFLAPRTAVTNVTAARALQTIACEHHAASCLEIKHLLHALAFVLSRGRSSVCEKISQFGTTKVATKAILQHASKWQLLLYDACCCTSGRLVRAELASAALHM